VSTRRQRSQHHKGKKRPGGWHQGPSLARQQIPRLRALEQAEARGRTADDELRAVAARYNEDVELLAGLRRAAPFVPRVEAA
jgi:hypothetical protein